MQKTWLSTLLLAGSLLLGLTLLGCASTPGVAPPSHSAPPPTVVGFDLDDTLVFSSPAFDEAAARGLSRDSEAYWEAVNSSDAELSVVKAATLAILRQHQEKGDRIFVITARHPNGVEPVVNFVHTTFGINKENVFFETNGKAGRIKALGISVFYGDSDADIEAAQEAGARAVRILRSPLSSYRKHYNPGSFGEEVIEGSEY